MMLVQTCTDKMDKEEVARVRAAYGLTAAASIGPTEREELAALLLAGTRTYDLNGAEYMAWRAANETAYMAKRRRGQAEASEHRAKLRAKRKEEQKKKRKL